ncbi:MAG: type II toxin-antitoxin system VapC family toxin [Devosia sp.]
MIVVDASVAVQWIAWEETSELSDTLLARSDLVAPDFMQVEVANALRRKVYVGEISAEQARAGLSFIRDKVALRRLSPAILDRALDLSVVMYHPIYDCIYLAVAEQEGGLLVTFDNELKYRIKEHGLANLLAELPLASP